MSVTERLREIGDFDLTLLDDTPPDIAAQVSEFGIVYVTDTRVGLEAIDFSAGLTPSEDIYPDTDVYPAVADLFTLARWAGVVLSVSAAGRKMTGHGMGWWLGDPDGKGAILTSPVTFNGADNPTVTARLCPRSLAVGVTYDLGARWSARHYLETPRVALDKALTGMGGEWRVNADGTLDTGTPEQLYGDGFLYPEAPDFYDSEIDTYDSDFDTYDAGGIYPDEDLYALGVSISAVIVRGAVNGADPRIPGLAGFGETARNADTYATEAVVADNGVITAIATLNTSAYIDPLGNSIRLAKVIDRSSSDLGSPAQVAALTLSQLTTIDPTLDASLTEGDSFPGEWRVGAWVGVYDPEAGIYDLDNQQVHRGRIIFPRAVRVHGATWPVTADMGVVYRSARTGEFIDLTEWVAAESGDTRIEVGDIDRPLLTA